MASDGITRSPNLFPQTVPESSGLDPTSKRRLQNRLNQRASRQRRALQKSSLGGGRDQRWVIYTNEARIQPDDQSKKSSPVANTTSRLGKSQKVQNFGSSYYHAATQMIREQYWTQLKKKVAEGAANKVQSPQLLLPVTQFNSMRAMFENAASMGLTMDVLSEDIASCFNIAGPLNLRLPPSLNRAPHRRASSIILGSIYCQFLLFAMLFYEIWRAVTKTSYVVTSLGYVVLLRKWVCWYGANHGILRRMRFQKECSESGGGS